MCHSLQELKYTYANMIRYAEYVSVMSLIPHNLLKFCDEAHFSSRGSCMLGLSVFTQTHKECVCVCRGYVVDVIASTLDCVRYRC